MSKTILKLSLLLLTLCAICTALVTEAYEVTRSVIAQRQEKIIQSAYREVLPQADSLTRLGIPPVGVITDIMASEDANGVNGYIYTLETKGYGGGILFMAGISHPDGILTGAKVIRQSETPGLGGKCASPDFLAQFSRLSLTKPLRLAKTPAADKIQAITAATITSKAIVSGINAARTHYHENFAHAH